MKISAAVLAGGRSRRMGTDKALISIGGIPLAEHVARRLDRVSNDVFVVAKQPLSLDRRVVLDASGAQTPLAGIAAAMSTATHTWVFVCACDMPLVSPELVSLLTRLVEDADVVCPVHQGRPEPLCALWSAEAGGEVESALAAGRYSVREVIGSLRACEVSEEEWREVDPEGASFTNLNSPGDLARVDSALAPRR